MSDRIETIIWDAHTRWLNDPTVDVNPGVLILATLRTARIAVIEMPEKLGEDAPYWRTPIGGEPEEVYPTPLGHIVISGAARLDSAEEARALAAALLAAAEVVDQ
ncbi:DNA methyltransferase [Mycobacterium phage MooMoo]|uniref:Uncharacterized protein n=1 Tax=Mycobacterium phage MooMoo TaxID=2108127 RepID=A0A2P1JR85_9CAUD|nr:DNA methyltransferase [Mycobacterium phage MooMoo]AVO21655.1 hypothetical protein SEA_MOOMOO_50 [Mycobacterium phage MooMoo]